MKSDRCPRVIGLARRVRGSLATAVVAVGIVIGSSVGANAALVNIDGTLPLDLVADSRLFAVESYSDRIYELTDGPKNAVVDANASIAIDYNLGATYDPDSGLVYFITGGFTGCALNKFDPETSTKSLVVTLSTGGSPLTGCRGLSTRGGGTGILAAGSTLYDINLVTGALSSARVNPCPGASIAFDPTTEILYSGKNNGEFYRVDFSETDATCTLVTTLVDVVDGGGENLKGFTFDTDGTLYLLSRWAPQLFSFTPGDLDEPVNYYGDVRFTPADPPLPLDSLVMVYTPLPEPLEDGPAVAALSRTGFGPVGYGLFGSVLMAAAVAIAVARVGRRTS